MSSIASRPVKIGIIGGSGLNNPKFLLDAQAKKISTEFGNPSDGEVIEGRVGNVPCVLLARHGKNHTIMPSLVNYRANLLALKQLGCTHVVVSTACGSLKEKVRPGHFLIPDQFIDRTTKRDVTFYDGTSENFKGILHLPVDEPFCPRTRQILVDSCKILNFPVHENGTVVSIEGPRFSTKAESRLFASWGADIINMTAVPEAVLAKELGLCYASLAMVTDFDCWKEDHHAVDVPNVMKIMKENAQNGLKVFELAVKEIAKQDWTEYLTKMQRKSWEKASQNVRASIGVNCPLFGGKSALMKVYETTP